jgi:hypothetical protein
MSADAVDLQDRIAALERSTRRILPATEGAAGWLNAIESRVAEESEFLRDVLSHALAQFQRELLTDCKNLITEKLSQRIRGTHDPAATYSASDLVAKDGASFIARRDNPGDCPGGGWQLIARQGQRGIAGERGPAGRDAPRIVGWVVDRSAFTVAPKFSDGSTGPTLELRELFEPSQDDGPAQ